MNNAMADILARARAIRLVIFDVDGVLTDGRLYFDANGQEFKAFHSRDGHGLVMLQGSGVQVAILTGRHCEAVRVRMAGLGIAHVHQGCQVKAPVYAQLKRQLELPDEAIAYVGDDVVDLPVMRQVGLAIAPADAHPLVTREAHWRTSLPGGRGAGREVCDLIMEAQGTLAAACG